jgi:hypothetical protein
MINPAKGGGLPIRRRWPRIVFVVLLGLPIAFLVGVQFIPNKPGRRITELYRDQFAANADRFAFLHVEGDKKADLVVYSSSEPKLKIYRPRSGTIWSLSANAAKNGDLFVSYWKPVTPDQFRAGEQVKMKLLRCGIGGCAAFFDFPGSINSPIDHGNGELISSVPNRKLLGAAGRCPTNSSLSAFIHSTSIFVWQMAGSSGSPPGRRSSVPQVSAASGFSSTLLHCQGALLRSHRVIRAGATYGRPRSALKMEFRA